MTAITYRQGTIEDSFDVYRIFFAALIDLGERTGTMAITGGDDPEVLQSIWRRRRSLFEHLAKTAEQFWVAEKEDGSLVGVARSIRRGELFELTEFFVHPGEQSAGVGRELFQRAFPPQGTGHRSIIATTDDRALARYQKAGVYARFPIKYFHKEPEAIEFETDLSFEPFDEQGELFDRLAVIDEQIVGHRRDVDHRWLMSEPNRFGYLCRRGGDIVGYGYIGESCGPIALQDDRDFPAVLAFAENAAHQEEWSFGVEVPLINKAAIDYLFQNGFRMDAFLTLFMSDRPFGKFENYIVLSPPFFL
ncbi:MAG: GNAT family N-acetyltransferase [Anaerolineales bacterium]|nr:GNAT family N-acetyltransferase [Anaerolineales bacterium]